MNIYPAHERLDRADTLIAAREQARLADLLVFIDAYSGQHAGVRVAIATFDNLSNDWFSRTSRVAKPYVQFQLAEIERILAKAMSWETDQPSFSTPLQIRLVEALQGLADCIAGVDPMEKVFLEWTGAGGVLLDRSSAMARYLIIDNFGDDKIPSWSGEEEVAWRTAFDNAQRLLHNFLPEAVPHVQRELAVIIPLVSTEPRVSLSSTPASINGVFLASRVSAKYFAEAMVHEVSHDCLNRINLVEPLFREGGPGYYSPFRPDTRPASGLLHASYSFLNVIHYLYRVFSLEPRLAGWARDRLDTCLFNTILCSRMLAICDELPPAGNELVSTIARTLDEISNDYELRPAKELLDEKREHFDRWAALAERDCINFSKEVFEGLLANTPVRKEQVAVDFGVCALKPVSLTSLRANFRHATHPVVVHGESLVNKKTLQEEIENLSHKEVKVLEAKKHKGYSDTPFEKIRLSAHLQNFSDEELKNRHFLVIKNFQTEVSKDIWKKDSFFEEFWIDGEHTWMFFNASGLLVPLHNDSVNNLHCVVSGQKTFYVSPPAEVFHINLPEDDFNAGFSSFRPFDNIEVAESVGAFVTVREEDMLYLPKGWWHSVRYDSDCLAISAFDEATD